MEYEQPWNTGKMLLLLEQFNNEMEDGRWKMEAFFLMLDGPGSADTIGRHMMCTAPFSQDLQHQSLEHELSTVLI